MKKGHRTIAQLVVDEVSNNKAYTILTKAYGVVKVNLRKKKNSKHITHIGNNLTPYSIHHCVCKHNLLLITMKLVLQVVQSPWFLKYIYIQ